MRHASFIKKLDDLVFFMTFANDNIFTIMLNERRNRPNDPNFINFPINTEIFSKQIHHAAFLLGYSYFEAFLGDLAKAIYFSNPQMLPKDKQLSFQDILERDSYDNIVEFMISKEITSVFFQSMDKISDYFSKKFCLEWPKKQKDKMIEASLIRNCLMHNDSIVDEKLSKFPRYSINETISLSADIVNDFGNEVRLLSKDIDDRANEKFNLF